MNPLHSIKENIDQIVSDTKVQIKSIQNDLKILPETAQQLTQNAQVALDEVTVRIEALSKQLLNEKVLNDRYKLQVQKTVKEIHKLVNEALDSLKKAIQKAK